ncbi:MAG TPA: hypothetical protein VLW53_01130 [Candidatus Eisenbacteria bacterium]|nr:hypothetical protein [Candidatus Eisenbacteria bacterium]
MGTRDRAPVVAWAVLGILVGTSALAVLASYASGPMALGVALGGVVTALLLAWATRPPAGSDKAAGPARDEHREAGLHALPRQPRVERPSRGGRAPARPR